MAVVNEASTQERDTPVRCAHIVLYGADGTDNDLELDQIRPPSNKDDLLWVDIDCDSTELIQAIARRLQMPASLVRHLTGLGSTPAVRSYGDYLFVQAVAVEHLGDLKFEGAVLAIAAGPGFVLSVHHKPIGFIPSIREREHGETKLGMLNAGAFVASLLDWQLDTYFEAVSDFERAVERLEEAVLKGREDENTRELSNLRKGASRLRRMLAPHRYLFASLARPDFRPDDDEATARHFQRLDQHFERAMDIVENARDLVIGSFELLTNQIALRTNNAMRLLTFATVVIGCQTVIAGVLGMNFEAPFFKTASAGFWIAIAMMIGVTIVTVWWGKRKRWF